MRKTFEPLIVITLCLALTACGNPSFATSPTEILVLTSPTADQLLVQGTPAMTIAATPSATPSQPPAAAQQSTRVAVTVPAEPCSPLAENSPAELTEIVSAPYNPPPMGSDARHQGVDFSYYRRDARTSILGEGVQAVFAGRVAASISESFPYGNLVIIEIPATALPTELVELLEINEGESLYTLYAHMGAAPLVTRGDAVTACQPLGEVGKSGNAGVPHLHLEMRLGSAGQQFPSMAFYSTQTTQVERDNYVLWRMSGDFRHFDPMSVLAP
jgi:murein DD-endopeptidase MepM/ murein hydrolase activator NlpD